MINQIMLAVSQMIIVPDMTSLLLFKKASRDVLSFTSTTERERQLTTARANRTGGLTNGRAANWAPEVAFSPFRALSCRQLTFPFCC